MNSDYHTALKMIVPLLVLSLLFNYLAWRGVGELGDRVSHLQAQLHSEINRVGHEIGGVSRRVSDLQTAMAWHSTPEIEEIVYADDWSEAEVILRWEITEMGRDARVGLQYRYGDDRWDEAEVTRLSDLAYRASFSVPVELSAGLFNFGYSVTDGTVMESTTQAGGTATSGDSPLQYMIYVEDEGGFRASERKSVDLGKLGGYFEAAINKDRQLDEYRIQLIHRVMPDGVEVEHVDFIMVSGDDRLITAMKRDPADSESPSSRWTLSLSLEEERQFTHAGFLVRFTNEQEIEELIRISW